MRLYHHMTIQVRLQWVIALTTAKVLSDSIAVLDTDPTLYKKLSNPFRNYYIVLRNSWFCHKVKQPSIQKHVYSTFITTLWWYNLVVWNVKPYITLTTSFSQRLRVVCNSLYIGGLFFPQHGQKSKQTPTFQYSPLCILTLSSKLSPTNSDFI